LKSIREGVVRAKNDPVSNGFIGKGKDGEK